MNVSLLALIHHVTLKRSAWAPGSRLIWHEMKRLKAFIWDPGILSNVRSPSSASVELSKNPIRSPQSSWFKSEFLNVILVDLILGFIEESSKFLWRKWTGETQSCARFVSCMFFSCPSLSVLKQGLVRHCRGFYILKCLLFPEPNQIHPMRPSHFNSTERDASSSFPVSVAFHMILMHIWLIFLTNHRLVTGCKWSRYISRFIWLLSLCCHCVKLLWALTH